MARAALELIQALPEVVVPAPQKSADGYPIPLLRWRRFMGLARLIPYLPRRPISSRLSRISLTASTVSV